MNFFKIAKAAIFAAGLVAASSAANAVSLSSSVAFTDGSFSYPASADSISLPSGASWDGGVSVRMGNAGGVYRTPWDETSNGAVENATVGNSAAAAIKYFASGPGNLPNPAKLKFTGDQTSLSFLWGSPDTYNYLFFRLDGANVSTFIGSPITGSPSAGSVLVTFTGLFDEVWFESRGSNAFEFASITATPVPLPAAGWMLLAGIGGLVALRRKRST